MPRARSVWTTRLRLCGAAAVCVVALGASTTAAHVVAAACAFGTDPGATGHRGDLLLSTAVDATGDQWTVGIHYDGGLGTALALRSSGGAWRSVPVRIEGRERKGAALQDVAVQSAREAWAVGTNGHGHAIVVRWDRGAWVGVGLPSDAIGGRELLGVAVVSPEDVWAVGKHAGAPSRTLIDHWDGTAWSEVASPNVGLETNVLNDVVAVGPTDVWAVGFHVSGGLFRTLVEHWDGSTWRVVDSPDAAGADDVLMGVAAGGADDVWAVGWSGRGSESASALVLHFDGSRWTSVDVPNPSVTRTQLLAVAPVPGGVLAVGRSADEGHILRPLALRWTDGGWTQSTVEPVAERDASLYAVASGRDGVVAVGSGQFAAGFGSITERGC